MAVINIYGGSKNWIEAVLSNLAHTPFILHETYIASVEGFHQGIKYADETRSQQIFELWGIKARTAGREANRLASGVVYWGRPPKEIAWQSLEYYDLYFEALYAKFTQDSAAKDALISTGQSRFSHIIPSGGGLGEPEFQDTHLCQSLYSIRDLITGTSGDLNELKTKCSNHALQRSAKRRR